MDPRDYARFQLNHRKIIAIDMRNAAENRDDEKAAKRFQEVIDKIDIELGKLDKL